MGFLDLLSGKKKESNSNQVPPPAPGPDKFGAPKPLDSQVPETKQDEKGTLPPPPAGNKEGEQNPFGNLNSPDKQPNEPTKDNQTTEQKKPEIPKPNGFDSNLTPPKLNVSNNMQPEPPRPPQNTNPAQNNNFQNPQMKQFSDDFDFPKLELPKFPGTEDIEEENENYNTRQTQNQQESVETRVTEKSNIVAPLEREEVQRTETHSPTRSYLSQNEMKLNDLKERLHQPKRMEGSDSSNIGNVESTLRTKTRNVKGPLFIEINNYKRVLHSLDEMKQDLNESQEFVLKLDEFNDKKYNEFEKWRKSIEYIHSKLVFVDKTLFKE